MLYSDLKGRKLVDTSAADTVGKVDGFLLDPSSRSVAALEFKKTDHGSTVAWSDLTAVGADAVTVAGTSVITDPEGRLADLATKDGQVLKKRVLSDAGEDLGKVHDIDLDPRERCAARAHRGREEAPALDRRIAAAWRRVVRRGRRCGVVGSAVDVHDLAPLRAIDFDGHPSDGDRVGAAALGQARRPASAVPHLAVAP